ncbi:MAG: nickel pincer cofactor biosynthesis protein LarC [Lentisphaerae bacterium]|nr:nickel pincer cofactor biosynthesis protein LarC [Lentisphaerota bacterium]
MRVIRFDPLGGASGDMILGALAGIGADLHGIFQELSAQLPDPVGVVVSPADSHGLHGLRASVSTESTAHDRWVDVSPHAGAEHGGGHHHHPEHRTLADVANLLGGRHPLALRVFERLAEAEGRVHGRAPSAVHFHEVGALDAIADIAGACLALRQLGVDGVSVGPLPCGTGTLTCAHGIMPNPAPATLLLLEGLETVQTDEPSELVTPTAAALFTTWTRELTPPPPRLRVIRSAFGFGRRTLVGRPNALRATLLETEAAGSTPDASGTESELCVLEANLDDCNPQWVGDLIARALAAGACDAWATPATFKKARPGIVFSVLAPGGLIAAIERLVFTATTTFGVRRYPVSRSILDRRFETASTPWGAVRVKIGSRDGQDLVRTPEYEDCARLADTAGITPRQVYEAAARLVTSA